MTCVAERRGPSLGIFKHCCGLQKPTALSGRGHDNSAIANDLRLHRRISHTRPR